MTAAAYRYADGEGKIPAPLQWLRYGERFGFEAIFGRQPRPVEMRQMIACENVVSAYNSRAAADDWVKWAKDNPAAAETLNQALKVAYGEQ